MNIELITNWKYKWFGLFSSKESNINLFPDFDDFVDINWSPEYKDKIVEYLKNTPYNLATSGTAKCKYCNEILSISSYYSDGTWLWPGYLTHYIEKHNIRVPIAFEKHIIEQNFIPPSGDRDFDFKDLEWPDPDEAEETEEEKRNKMNITCPECKKEVVALIGQKISNDTKLEWFKFFKCETCDISHAEEKFGMAPQKIREDILKRDGTWNLVINDMKDHYKNELRIVFRDELDYSLKEILEVIKKIPGVVYTGTKTEVEWLKLILEKKDLLSVVEKESL